jgi:hypothetical protein
LQLPAAHPFNPLSLMRLAIATDAQGYSPHSVCDSKFTEQAIAQGVFGVSEIQVNKEIFRGFDSQPVLRQYLEPYILL